MAKHLQVIIGPDQGRIFKLNSDGILLLGRSKTTQNWLHDPHVSRVHCQVQSAGDQVVITDASSASGTFVNGQRVATQQLQSGDLIRIGSTLLRFQDESMPQRDTLMMPAVTSAEVRVRETGSRTESAFQMADTLVPTDPATALGRDELARLAGRSLGRYNVEREIGHSNAGIVFAAHDTKHNRKVALKVLWPELIQAPALKDRFLRAMRLAERLRHPNLVQLYGAGKRSGYCWLAMEFVEGDSLAGMVPRVGVDRRLTWRFALKVGCHVARALDAVHRQRIVHRNVSPGSVLIPSAGTAIKLGGLMLAKAFEGILAEPLTLHEEILGDLAFISPEQTYGPRHVDARSDIYSLGATVYAALTGRPPFAAPTTEELVDKIRREEPVPPKNRKRDFAGEDAGPESKHAAAQLASLPPEFEDAVLRMLEKRPENRYQAAHELIVDLNKLGEQHSIVLK